MFRQRGWPSYRHVDVHRRRVDCHSRPPHRTARNALFKAGLWLPRDRRLPVDQLVDQLIGVYKQHHVLRPSSGSAVPGWLWPDRGNLFCWPAFCHAVINEY